MGLEENGLQVSVRAILYSKGDKGTRFVVVENRPYPRHQKKRGFFRLPGGTMEEGETEAECLRRELWEELRLPDIESISSRPINSYHYVSPKIRQRKLAKVYVVGMGEHLLGTLKHDARELLGYELMGPRKAINTLHYPNEKAALEKFCGLRKLFKYGKA